MPDSEALLEQMQVTCTADLVPTRHLDKGTKSTSTIHCGSSQI